MKDYVTVFCPECSEALDVPVVVTGVLQRGPDGRKVLFADQWVEHTCPQRVMG